MEPFIEAVNARLLATSVQTTLLAAVAWLLCRYLRRLSPAAQCWLWWLVALQALTGLFVEPIQLPWLPHASPQLAALAPAMATYWNTLPAHSPTAWAAIDNTRSPWPSALFLLWLSGIAAMGWLTLHGWRRARALLRASTPCTDESLLRVLAQAAAARGLRRVPRLHLSRDIHSPLVAGRVRPVLLLPASATMSGEELDMILAHELTHLRRGDLWWGCVPALARHLFFFHPFAHLAAREYGIAREADCDAAVVEVDRHCRRDYGRLLLRLETAAGAGPGLAVASSNFHALRRRLTMLQNTSFLPRAGSIALLILVAAVGVMPLRLVQAAATAPATVVAGDPGPLVAEPRRPVAGTPRAEEHQGEAKKKVAATNRPAEIATGAAAAAADTEALRQELRELRQRLDEIAQSTQLRSKTQVDQQAYREAVLQATAGQQRSFNSARTSAEQAELQRWLQVALEQKRLQAALTSPQQSAAGLTQSDASRRVQEQRKAYSEALAAQAEATRRVQAAQKAYQEAVVVQRNALAAEKEARAQQQSGPATVPDTAR
jgi:beta-lactamase regulating signal transducer with metallopeptidase domain